VAAAAWAVGALFGPVFGLVFGPAFGPAFGFSGAPPALWLPLLPELRGATPAGRTAVGWADTVTHQISQHCAAFLDEGQARWHLAVGEGGLLGSWRRQIEADRSLPWRHCRAGLQQRLRAWPAAAGAGTRLPPAAVRGAALSRQYRACSSAGAGLLLHRRALGGHPPCARSRWPRGADAGLCRLLRPADCLPGAIYRVGNGWLHLLRIDPQESTIEQYLAGGWCAAEA